MHVGQYLAIHCEEFVIGLCFDQHVEGKDHNTGNNSYQCILSEGTWKCNCMVGFDVARHLTDWLGMTGTPLHSLVRLVALQ